MDRINRLKPIMKDLQKARITGLHRLEDIWMKPGDYIYSESTSYSYVHKERDGFIPYKSNQVWGGVDAHYWFMAQWEITKDYVHAPLVIQLHTGATDIWNTDNPQIMVYKDGVLIGSMDMNHHTLLIETSPQEGNRMTLVFYAYSNTERATNFFDLKIGSFQSKVNQLYYDLSVPYEAACLCEADDPIRMSTLETLNDAVNQLDLREIGSAAFYNSIDTCLNYLKEAFYSDDKKDVRQEEVVVNSIGHTHIDVAWKWPVKQTRQKVVRSFSNVIRLMEQYPEYTFMSSQPQLYAYVKEDAPQLFEKIQEKVREGRWEVEGGMWLEADCNLASGESLIRQIYYGRQFFKENFGIEKQEILWLPDVFGYCVALPQIMEKSGIRYFMTTKLGWNEYNQMPHDLFTWQGNNGSEILTYFITTVDYEKNKAAIGTGNFSTTYNGLQNPSQIKGTWQRFQDKGLTNNVLTCYGYGDGGGGPTESMLEQDERLQYGVCGCPKTRQSFVNDFFIKVEKDLAGKKIPKWCGELYLESHRGTYTSMAKNKRYNRRSEGLMQDLEFMAVLENCLGKESQDRQERLDRLWKVILLNQFHDILPGSSIQEVYEETDRAYEDVFEQGLALRETMYSNLHDSITGIESVVTFVNTVGFERETLVQFTEDEKIPVGMVYQLTRDKHYIGLTPLLPPKSLVSVKSMSHGIEEKRQEKRMDYGQQQIHRDEDKEKGHVLYNRIHSFNGLVFESNRYEVEMNGQGEFARLYDKEAEREIIMEEGVMNRLVAYEDKPASFDAWNIDAFYTEKSWVVDQVDCIEIVENGPIRGTLKVQRQYRKSEITQYIHFYAHSRRIDVETYVCWQEHQTLLKALFDTSVFSHTAHYDVQFGQVERMNHKNTTWEEAKFEVCAHKWMDLSETGYGVAILNDCKYGHHIHEKQMQLTLIKSGVFPNPQADIGDHAFTYSILPHIGDYREGRVSEEAYDLNTKVLRGESDRGRVGSWSFAETPATNIVMETIKPAYDKDGIILRLYENHGKRVKTHITFPLMKGKKVWVCDMMEHHIHALEQRSKGYLLEVKPYEIVTLKIQA